MSTEQSADPRMVEQAERHIRLLVEEIARLARQDLPPRAFFGEFLSRVVRAMAAVGGAVWLGEGQAGFQVAAQVGWPSETAGDRAQHEALVERVAERGQARLVAPTSEGAETDNPTVWLLVLAPIKLGDEVAGVLEVLQRPEAAPQAHRGYMRFAGQVCELASDYLRNYRLRLYEQRERAREQVDDFVRAVHGSLQVRQTAYTLANDGRRLLGCDRLTVAIAGGRGVRVEAISGQDSVERRSNVVRLLAAVARAAATTGEGIWYDGDDADLPPQLQELIHGLADVAHCRQVIAVPLRRPKPVSGGNATSSDQPVVGVLVVEQYGDSLAAAALESRMAPLREHGGLALANALSHDRLLLRPLGKAHDKLAWLVEVRNLPKTGLISGAIMLLIAALVFVPYELAPEGRGTLEPVHRRDVFAPADGVVERVHVRMGDTVAADGLLVELRNTDLEVSIADIAGQLTSAQQQLLAVGRAMLDDERRLRTDERNRLAAQELELRQRVASLERQQQLYEEKRRQLEVRSPIGGQVTTWDVENLLAFRPVRRGQALVSVADVGSDWEVEVRMPEDRMGHILQSARGGEEPLEVSFVLATDPATVHRGRVREIHPLAEVRGDEGSVVLVKVAIDKQSLAPYLRPGAEVRAKLHCGRRALGYVLFYDLVQFVHSRILFRL